MFLIYVSSPPDHLHPSKVKNIRSRSVNYPLPETLLIKNILFFSPQLTLPPGNKDYLMRECGSPRIRGLVLRLCSSSKYLLMLAIFSTCSFLKRTTLSGRWVGVATERAHILPLSKVHLGDGYFDWGFSFTNNIVVFPNRVLRF